MKKEFMEKYSGIIGTEPLFINSALVSAQNRQRYYWCNWDITAPEDKGVLLADIIEDGVTEREKSFCIDANYSKGGNLNQYLNKNRRQLVFENPYVLQSARGNNLGGIRGHENQKVPCVSSSSRQHNNKLVYQNGIRKLTTLECERLQTVPDNYTLVLDENGKQLVSNTQRYKMLGNGWTVDVIKHLLCSLKASL